MRLIAEIDTDDGDVLKIACAGSVATLVVGKKTVKISSDDLIKALRHVGVIQGDDRGLLDDILEQAEAAKRAAAREHNAREAKVQLQAYMAQRGTDPTPEALERKARFEAIGPDGDIVQDGQPKRRISPRFSMSAKKAPPAVAKPADFVEAVQALPDFDTMGLFDNPSGAAE